MNMVHMFCNLLFVGGKRDKDLVLPINSSLSVTLDQEQVRVNNAYFCSLYFVKKN